MTKLVYGVVLCVLCTLQITFAASTKPAENPYLAALKKHPWQSLQEYVQVRAGAHLFYWLYYADGTREGADFKPLVIWIQGGPGLAATGIGNFAEIGPLDMHFRPRTHTWAKGRNVLLIDHPVGAGFSYVTNSSLMVNTDRGMIKDLAKAIRAFFRRHKHFQKTPTYIFGQSYGGKLTPRLAWHLNDGIQKKLLKINLKGIGIGSGWVSPKESSLVQPSFLYSVGVIDYNTFKDTSLTAVKIAHSIDKRDYDAAEMYSTLNINKLNDAGDMDNGFNNINQGNPYPVLEKLEIAVNAYVKPTLSMVNQNRTWHYISEQAFMKLRPNFMMSTATSVELLLNHTSLRVAVYNGNLDAITPFMGASNWVHKLRWSGAEDFMKKNRSKIQGHKNGFYKSVGPLSFWSVFGSGHWVPEDNPAAMEHILYHVIDRKDGEE